MKITRPPSRPRGRSPKARGRSRLLFLLLLALCAGAAVAAGGLSTAGRRASAAPPQEEPGISPEALAQIESLIAEKESRTGAERKIDSQLIYELKMQRGEWIADRVAAVETDVEYNDDGKIVVDIKAEVSDGLLGQLKAGGAEILDTVAEAQSIRASVPLDLEIDITIDDPKAYTRPFTVRVEQTVVADGSEMIEFICHENQMFLKMTGRQ